MNYLELTYLSGEKVYLNELRGTYFLLVNIASHSDFTFQLEGLQRLYEQYWEEGLNILAFPSNDFDECEPLENESIASFLATHFGISFPVFQKTSVIGEQKHPIYTYLYEIYPQPVKSNFEKFLMDREGQLIEHYDSVVEALEIKEDIDELI